MSAPVQFSLPGAWWRVDIEDDDTVAASSRAMVSTLFRGDELAQLRREVKGLVTEAATKAREAGAQKFYFATEVVPGVPVPLTLATYLPDLPPRLAAAAGAQASAESLAAWLRSVDPEATLSAWSEGDLGFVRDLSLVPAEQEQGAPTVRADYWIVRGEETTIMSFTAQVLWGETAEALLSLMDAVVATVEWPSEDAAQR